MNVATVQPELQLAVPWMFVGPGPVRVKFEPAVIVPEFIASLKVAVTVVVIAAVVLALAGVTAETDGGVTVAVAVVNDQV